MHKRLCNALVLSLLLCAMAALLPSQAAAKKKAAAGPYAPAQECGKCHSDIFRNWEKSLHALSYNNPIFLAAYYKAYTETSGAAAKYCLACHAPAALLSGDYALSQPVTREGVTCDFCHSVTKISMDAEPGRRFTLAPGKVKRSALKKPSTSAHPAEYSADFASATLCAGCHDFKNRRDVHVGATYEEWRASKFARDGVQCQECHMPKIDGRTANKDGGNGIHDHSLSHTAQTMKNAISIDAALVKRPDHPLEGRVSITNTGAGHSLPTGTPARGLAVEVALKDASGNTLERQTRTLKKTVADKAGNILASDGDAFLHGAAIIGDNRPKPGETVTETFVFSTDPKKADRLDVEVYFIYRPLTLSQTEMKIPLSADGGKP